MNFTRPLFLTTVPLVNMTDHDLDLNTDQSLLNRDIANTIWRYTPPLLILLGTFGNVLTIVILCRKPIWKLSSSPYLVVLSVADITVLYSGLLRQWIIHLTGVDIRLTSAALCKLHTTFVYTATDFSVWILVTVTVERFTCACFPFKAKRICNRGRAKIIIVVLLLLVFLVNCHFLFGLGSVYDVESGELISHCELLSSDYVTFRENVWPWVDLSKFSLIPFIIIVLCNICLMTKIRWSWRRNKVFPKEGTKITRTKPSMTALLVSLNAVFLVTTGPVCIYILIDARWDATDQAGKHPRSELWLAIVNQLMYLNNSVNFIFYCVTGPQFRLELKAMLQLRNAVMPTRTLPHTQQPPVKPQPATQPPTMQTASSLAMDFPVPSVKNNT